MTQQIFNDMKHRAVSLRQLSFLFYKISRYSETLKIKNIRETQICTRLGLSNLMEIRARSKKPRGI